MVTRQPQAIGKWPSAHGNIYMFSHSHARWISTCYEGYVIMYPKLESIKAGIYHLPKSSF